MNANFIYTIAGDGDVTSDNVSTAISNLNAPCDISLDSLGNIYIADSENHRIRFVPKAEGSYFGRSNLIKNNIYTIAGTGSSGAGINGTPLNSALTTPNSVTVDNSGNVYITDTGNHRIRFISVSRSRNLLYYNKEYFNKNSGYYINNVDCFLNNSTVYEKL
jgi:sugar lactone lactonase YvrE